MSQFKFSHPKCPKCNQPADKVLETLQAFAFISVEENGHADYVGESDMLFDTQVPMYQDNGTKVILSCCNYHEWYSLWK